MRYENLKKAIFLERPNRFVARVRTEDLGELAVHVPNTGRCRELFIPGAVVWLEKAANPRRKYAYTLVSVYKGNELVQIVSVGANRMVAEALQAGTIRGLEALTEIRAEQSFGHSRFDFSFRRHGVLCYLEVKGVTLEEERVAKFPDAPTERGARHLQELIAARKAGFGAYAIFVAQMKGVDYFTPHRDRDPAFAASFNKAAEAGVVLMAYDARITPEEAILDREIPVIFGGNT